MAEGLTNNATLAVACYARGLAVITAVGADDVSTIVDTSSLYTDGGELLAYSEHSAKTRREEWATTVQSKPRAPPPNQPGEYRHCPLRGMGKATGLGQRPAPIFLIF